MLARIFLGGAAAAAALVLSGCRRQDHPELRREVSPQNSQPDLRLPSTSTSKFSPPSATPVAPANETQALQVQTALFHPDGPRPFASALNRSPSVSILSSAAPEPDQPAPVASAAASLYRRRAYGEAIKAAQAELGSAPQSSGLYYILGTSQGQVENFQEAAKSLEMAAQLNPNNAQTHFALGSCYLKMHQSEPGVSHLKRAEVLSPELKPLIAQLLEGEALPSEGRPRREVIPPPPYEARFD